MQMYRVVPITKEKEGISHYIVSGPKGVFSLCPWEMCNSIIHIEIIESN